MQGQFVPTIKVRRDFLRLRGGSRFSCADFVLETRPRPDSETRIVGPRFGYTVTKRIGNAVVRNRIKRRLRAAVASLPRELMRADHDYVLVARSAIKDRQFTEVTAQLRGGLAHVHRRKRNSGSAKHRQSSARTAT